MICGIDFSITSPSVCVFNGDDFILNNCEFHFITSMKYLIGKHPYNINGMKMIDYSCQQERFDFISNWLMSLVCDADEVFLEGYSMGSKGKVFDIAEATGLFKHSLWDNNIKFTLIPPSVIKKFATGKGNADKVKMGEQFTMDTGINIHKSITPKMKLGAGVSTDIIDSYYICKYGVLL